MAEKIGGKFSECQEHKNVLIVVFPETLKGSGSFRTRGQNGNRKSPPVTPLKETPK